VLQQTYRFRKRDIILFLPALAHPVSMLPYFLKPRAEKIEFLQKVIQQPELITLEEESALPGGVLFIIRILIGLLAVTGQAILLYRWYRLHKDTLHKEQQNRDTFNWLIRFTSMTVFYWILILFEIIYHRGASSQLNYSLIIVISGTILFVSLYLMVQPSLLYGIKGWNQQAPMILSENPVEAEKEVRKYALTQEQGQLIKIRLEAYLSKDAPFRKLGFTIADLSHAIDVPVHQISAFINQEYARNFNELINGYRIDYLLARQEASNDFDQYTLEALSREAGFNSRAAFITAAKKYTGKTPSELFRRRQERK
jgi:AraC-like DNA-binding protein